MHERLSLPDSKIGSNWKVADDDEVLRTGRGGLGLLMFGGIVDLGLFIVRGIGDLGLIMFGGIGDLGL